MPARRGAEARILRNLGLFLPGGAHDERGVEHDAARRNDDEIVLLDVVPTAENLARIAFRLLDPAYRDSYGNHLRLERVRLYETPNCWADATRDDLP